MPKYKYIFRQIDNRQVCIRMIRTTQTLKHKHKHTHTKQSNYGLENIGVYFASLNAEIGIIYEVSWTSEMNILLIESGLCMSIRLYAYVSIFMLCVAKKMERLSVQLFHNKLYIVCCCQTIAINRKHNWWEDPFTFTEISG